MTLPAAKSAWPPADQTQRYDRMRTTSVWYGGDPEQLKAFYGGGASAVRDAAGRGIRRVLQATFGWMWGRVDTTEDDGKLHVPVAQDIATMSSELLFARTPRFAVQHTMFTADGIPNPAQDAAVAKTQARLDDILDSCNFDALLLAAGEISSALGSTGLKIAWDKEKIADRPVIARIDADACVPEYTWGVLTATTFWSIVERDGETIWYWLERHEPGRIQHGLYKGVRGNLGLRMPLSANAITAPLEGVVDAEGYVNTVPDYTTGISIPNMLPDPLDRMQNAGRSDFTPGVIQLFDAIDKTYTSMMRDIDDGRSRLLVADYMLESKGLGKGVEFDTDQHLFTKLKMQPADNGDAPISQVQFKIRVEEHIAAIDKLTTKAVQSSGYSPQSLGDYEAGSAMTATEVEARERKSISTMSKKRRYWTAIEGLLEALLAVDAQEFKSGIEVLPVRIEWQPVATDDLSSLAATVKLMKEAEAASLEVRVKTLHPDWEQPDIDAEVEKIQNESSVVDPASFGMPGAAGAPGGELDPVDDELVA